MDRPSTNSASSLSEAIRDGLAFPKSDQRQAAQHADKLLACYPQAKPTDARGYIAAVVAVLAEYPEEIVARVTDPRTGVVRTCRFLPTIAELTEALESAMEPLRRRWRDERERRQTTKHLQPQLTDASARARVLEKARELSEQLAAAPDPIPPRRDGTAPVGVAAAGPVARVLSDIAARSAEREAAE